MTRLLLAGAAAIAAFTLPAAPAAAQVQNGTLVIYGNDKCPTNSSGEEIVVCVRRSERERFRIPKELRDAEPTRDGESWATRVEDNLNVGGSGTGSCSTAGVGGQTGCFIQRANAARAERRARAKAQSAIPLP